MRIIDWSSDVCSSDLELDAAKKGSSEIARNARQVSRFLDELMQDKNHTQIEKGLSLPGARASSNGNGKTGNPATGKLYFQTRPTEAVLPGLMPGKDRKSTRLNSSH